MVAKKTTQGGVYEPISRTTRFFRPQKIWHSIWVNPLKSNIFIAYCLRRAKDSALEKVTIFMLLFCMDNIILFIK